MECRMTSPTAQDSAAREPKPPFPAQHQLESDVTPAPRYEAAEYLAAGKLTEGVRA
jgi:hypothetical protein